MRPLFDSMPDDRAIDFKKISDSLAALAEADALKNGLQKMDAGERNRFDANLNEADLAFIRYRASSIGSEKTKKIITAIHHDIKKNAGRVTQLIRESGAIKSLLEAQEDLHRLADQFEERDDRTDIKKGRPETDPNFLLIVFWLGSAWKIGARRPPGTSNSGPFVRFVITAAQGFNPNDDWETPKAFGDTIKQAVSQIKKVAWGKK